MTICIGALCANAAGMANQIVIAASDRMVTLGGFMEFEHEVPKAMELAPRVVGLMAGDAVKGSRVQREARRSLPAEELTVQDVAERVAALYATHRHQEVDTTLFSPRGFTMADFYGGGLIQRVPPQIAQFLDTQAASFDFSVELLVSGVDANGGHLLRVSNPGGSTADYEQIGFHAIGSGAIHALQALIGFRHTGQKPLADALYHVYAAKRRAEVAPGVGNETDMLIITMDKGIYRLTPADLTELDKIYQQETPSLSGETRQALADMKICKEVQEC